LQRYHELCIRGRLGDVEALTEGRFEIEIEAPKIEKVNIVFETGEAFEEGTK